MTKFILLMVLCSGVAQNECKVMPTKEKLFDNYHSCIVYGYYYSHKMLTELDPEWVNSMEVYTKFSCKPHATI